MVRKILGKVKRFFVQDVSLNDGKNPDNKTLEKLINKTVPGRELRANSNKQLIKSDEALHYINMIKNGMTVKTGEYEAVTRIFTGQKMYVDTRDVSESPHLMLDGIREHGITEFFQKFAFNGMNYYDVGANFGYNTLLIGAVLRDSGSLHLFEANEDLIPLLNKTLSVNGLTNRSKVNNVAVTEKSGETVTLHRYKDLWGGSSIHSKSEMEKYRPIDVEFDKDYEVSTVSIDDYVKDNPVDSVDLIKIDVEGVEDRVYDGMTNTIKRPEVHVLLEFTFGAYRNDKDFFNKIKRDFANVDFVSDQNGQSRPVGTFEELKDAAEYEWAMIHLYH